MIFFIVKALILLHAAQMLSLLQALHANCGRVFIFCGLLVDIVLVDSFLAHLAVQVLEIDHHLHFIRDRQALLATKYVKVSDFVNFLLALGARVLHLFHPLFDARKAVNVSAGI